MFEISVRKHFWASHALVNYMGADEAPHGHDWICEVKIAAEKLDKSGCAMDFVKVDKLLDEITGPFTGRLINELEAFAEKSPSAENIAEYIFNNFSRKMDGVKCVTVWEDANHSASYLGQSLSSIAVLRIPLTPWDSSPKGSE